MVVHVPGEQNEHEDGKEKKGNDGAKAKLRCVLLSKIRLQLEKGVSKGVATADGAAATSAFAASFHVGLSGAVALRRPRGSNLPGVGLLVQLKDGIAGLSPGVESGWRCDAAVAEAVGRLRVGAIACQSTKSTITSGITGGRGDGGRRGGHFGETSCRRIGATRLDVCRRRSGRGQLFLALRFPLSLTEEW